MYLCMVILGNVDLVVIVVKVSVVIVVGRNVAIQNVGVLDAVAAGNHSIELMNYAVLLGIFD